MSTEKKVPINESREHFAYKKVAIDILMERGFKPPDIHEEYNVEFQVNGKLKYEVDVVGIRGDYKVAIECGTVGYQKLLDLRKIFSEVIIINAETVVNMYESWKANYFEDTRELKVENTHIKERMEWLEKDLDGKIEPYQREIEDLKKERDKLKLELGKIQMVIARACQALKEQS